MEIQRGFRSKLSSSFDIQQIIDVSITVSGPAVYDMSCFGLDAEEKLSDDRFMIFYNQPNGPENAITMTQENKTVLFRIHLQKLSSIQKLSFTVSIDGDGKMGEIHTCNIRLSQNGAEPMELNLTGNSFQNEKAIIAIEIYQKGEWRINAVARGFDGGLPELLKLYGGIEEKTRENKSVEEKTTHKISLEKKLEKAPSLISFAKPIQVCLEKKQLNDVKARVGLVLDISGSMVKRYKNGTVQMIVNKVLPLAVQFDDNGELDFWYYGSHTRRMEAITLKNYERAVPTDWLQLMQDLGGCNYEPEAMQSVIEEYKNSKIPAYIIFITDGGVSHKGEIKKIMKEASNYPIFWQFVGVGGYNYGVLENLDTMSGRTVDNANFFALDDFKTVPDHELYERLLNEFPSWLKAAREHNIY